ncbi:MAG: DNA polymerase I [Treponemataceae bacterium]|nr:MAG: DNA polymerase I [Treponemataceae bacterium]
MSTVYLLDSYALIYRSYFAFISRPLTNKNGQNVSAIYGFFRNIKTALDRYKIEHIAAAFDSRAPTFRHAMYSEYKATRPKAPEDLHTQVPMIEEILSALGIPALYCEGFEADDIIATVCRLCAESGNSCRILSGDKDLMQLISPDVEMMRSDKAGGWEHIDERGVLSEWGVTSAQMLDLLSLMGDTADNVPGVAGVGIKTAVKLINEYGTLENLYARAEEIPGAAGKKIRAGKDSAFFSKKLIELRRDTPLFIGGKKITSANDLLDVCSTAGLDYSRAADALMKAGVPNIAKIYGASEEAVKKTVSRGGDLFASQAGGSAETARDALPAPSTADSAQEILPLKKNTGDYTALVSARELAVFIDSILSGDKKTAFDLETDSLDTAAARWVGFSLSAQQGKAVYVPLAQSGCAQADSDAVSIEDAKSEIAKLFQNKDCVIIMHNGKFDLEVLRAQGMRFAAGGGDRPDAQIFDTMIAAWLLEADRSSFSLESLSRAKLGLETIAYKDIVPKGSTFADVPLDKAVQYAAEDADLTRQLYEYYEPKIREQKLEDLFWSIEMPLVPILAEMELEGIRLETEELACYGAELGAKIKTVEREIYDIVGHEFNIASPQQLQDVLFTERKLPTGKKTKTGFSTDIAVLEDLAALDPVPRKILEYRTLTKLKSTYVDALIPLADSRSRVHTSFMQTGTATGRLSSRDPNLQNIPVREEEGRKIRSAFAAEKGKILVSADYSQIELVILAHLSEDEHLCRAFLSGGDVHRTTAALIFGKPESDVTPDMRRAAKTINFGVMYGMSAFRLANALDISRAQAQDFLSAYNATYAGVQDYFTRVIEKAEKTGYVETIFGRRRALPAITSRNRVEKAGAERIAKNTPIQGSAADIVKKAMIALDAALKNRAAALGAKSYRSAKLLLQVHDELILECAERDADETRALVKEVMEGVITLRVPLKVSVEHGTRWGDFH